MRALRAAKWAQKGAAEDAEDRTRGGETWLLASTPHAPGMASDGPPGGLGSAVQGLSILGTSHQPHKGPWHPNSVSYRASASGSGVVAQAPSTRHSAVKDVLALDMSGLRVSIWPNPA